MNIKTLPDISPNLKTYTIGSMEKTGAGNFGEGWRQVIAPKLKARGIYVFDPTTMESQKTGLTTPEINSKLAVWITSGHIEEFLQAMDSIWEGKTLLVNDSTTPEDQILHLLGDYEYVLHSDFLILHYDKGDSWGGTLIEIALAYYIARIPIYLVTKDPISTINKSALRHILMSGVKRGAYKQHNPVFESFNQLLEYLDKTYNLKEKEEKK